jgi:hypothetical protein
LRAGVISLHKSTVFKKKLARDAEFEPLPHLILKLLCQDESKIITSLKKWNKLKGVE